MSWPTIRIMMVANLYGYGRMANYPDNDSWPTYADGRWPTIRIWKVANYTGNGRWPTIGIMKVANYTDM